VRIYHGTTIAASRSIRTRGLRKGTCVTARRDHAINFYCTRAVNRAGVPEAGGLLVVADVPAADLAPAPRAASPDERAFRLAVPIDPDELELIGVDIDRERLDAMHARERRRRAGTFP
jgi:hypothetical protein